ncbi:hypothetical protein CGK45_22250 [Vibrio parahaemolyticus]|uniref:GNAT family N-acetyltransferase n=1 Tax=Vibrio parahaemolyticus TaxID=670 RepID=UPI0011218EA0|nr:GNAT family protein [Vibrio parahaemolyticus]TNZ56082.1 hypothetical protein CGK45_22250 [Vibrio parahaemolyticus]
MSLVVRQVTLDDAEGITNVLNPIIIEGLYTVLDTTFTPEEEKELFNSTFEVAKQKGYEKLFAYVRSDNERALAAYLKQGFEIVGTAKKHAKVRGEYVDEVLIEKFL